MQHMLLVAVALWCHAGIASAFSLAPLSPRYLPPHSFSRNSPPPDHGQGNTQRRTSTMAPQPEHPKGFGRCAACL